MRTNLPEEDVFTHIASLGKVKSSMVARLSGESMSFSEVVKIFMPVLVDQAFIILLNLVNSSMISSSGVAAISAVNMVDSLNFFLINIFVAISTGGTVVVAQFKGSGNEKMVSKSAAGSVSSVFLLALGISVTVIILHGPLLGMLFGSAKPDVFSNARIYLIGCSASYCGIATVESVCGAFRGVGETKSSFALSFTMNITYVLLNILFINVLHMGVLGMVIALNIARYFAAACAIGFLILRGRPLHYHFADTFHFNPVILKKIFYIGLPFAAEQLFFQGDKLLTQTFIVSMGTLAIDTNAISGSMATMYQIPANALSLTIITVVGQCIGRRNVPDARKFIKNFLVLASISFVMMTALLLPLFYPIISLFSPPASVVPDVYRILVINCIALITLWPISFITPSALRAAGDSKFTSVVAMLSMWLFRVVMGYLLGIVFKFGIVGVWLAMDCEWGVRGTVFLLRYHGDKWYRHNLV
jgi:putative MATE family efflux protein